MNPSSPSADSHETPEQPAPSANPARAAEAVRRPGIGAPRMRKPQSKSRLDGRSAELQAQLEVWLVDQNRGYEAMSELLAKEHGVTTTKSSLCRYYRRRLAPRRQARALFEAKARKLIAANGEEATLARARQLAFSALMEPQPDLPTAHRLLEMVTAIERTRLAQARAKLGTRP